MRIIEGYDFTFPIVGYNQRDRSQDNTVTPKNIYGTAFNIGGDFYMTAGHSITNALSENDTIGIGNVDGGTSYIGYEAQSYEILDNFDLGIIKTLGSSSRVKAHRWVTGILPSLYEVCASGYAYALDPVRKTIHSRSFKGYVVSMGHLKFTSEDIRVYELSFNCPRGLSGSPLITNQNDPQVAGIVVGNQSMRMLVFTDSEILKEGKETIVERYESLQLGIAVQSLQLFDTHSNLLSATIGEHLLRQSLRGSEIM